MALEKEYEYFKKVLPEFLTTHNGEFVLIKGEQVIGFFPTYMAAFAAGFDKFGRGPFFISQITEAEPTNIVFSAINFQPPCR